MPPKKKQKPEKPSPDFPLYAHASGSWARKVNGRTWYFGPWDDPDGSLKTHDERIEQIRRGATPETVTIKIHGVTLAVMCNYFLTQKKKLKDKGELSPKYYKQLVDTCKRLLKHMGRDTDPRDLMPFNFGQYRDGFPNDWGVHRITAEIKAIRHLFRYCADDEIIDSVPNFGRKFAVPSAKQKRRHKQRQESDHGKMMFHPEDVVKILEHCNWRWRALTLLAVNAGYGNTDIANVKASAFDLKRGTVTYGRQKTGVERMAVLWDETVQAVGYALTQRPVPKRDEDDDLAFLTEQGNKYVRDGKDGNQIDGVGDSFKKILKRCGLKRPGLNFYSLRRTFRTLAAGAKDPEAVNFIMGHAKESMGELYTQDVEIERLRDIAAHVHSRIWPQQ